MEKLYHFCDPITKELIEARFFEEGTQPENYIEKGNPGFLKPKYNSLTDEVYEGATSEEISFIKTPIYMEKLQNMVTDLRIRAKGSAIGKTGSNSYILSQVEFYEIKYQQCQNSNNSTEIEELLQNESDEFGLSLFDFKQLVISKYEYALNKYNLFMRMIERCRTKIQTLIENNNWINADEAFNLISALNNVDQANAIMNEILEL